jgi:phosphatidylserine/phosphatidylglycerophosphate/cardiolipin synthase-like enzyme
MAKPQRVNPASLPQPNSYAGLRDVFKDLDRYRVTPRTHGYPENLQHLFAPIDAVHEAVVALVHLTHDSAVGAFYSWNDQEINSIFQTKLRDEQVFVQLSLDSTQGYGPAEVPLLKTWRADEVGNSVALGHSAFSAINHDKMLVLDGVLTVAGSTNFSKGGEHNQNNEMVLVWDAVFAAEARARIDVIHDEMLMQMAARQQRLLVDWAAKKTKLSALERKKLLAGILPD